MMNVNLVNVKSELPMSENISNSTCATKVAGYEIKPISRMAILRQMKVGDVYTETFLQDDDLDVKNAIKIASSNLRKSRLNLNSTFLHLKKSVGAEFRTTTASAFTADNRMAFSLIIEKTA